MVTGYKVVASQREEERAKGHQMGGSRMGAVAVPGEAK